MVLAQQYQMLLDHMYEDPPPYLPPPGEANGVQGISHPKTTPTSWTREIWGASVSPCFPSSFASLAAGTEGDLEAPCNCLPGGRRHPQQFPISSRLETLPGCAPTSDQKPWIPLERTLYNAPDHPHSTEGWRNCCLDPCFTRQGRPAGTSCG